MSRTRPERLEYYREYRKRNREALRAKSQEYYRRNREACRRSQRDYELRTKYGINLSEYKALLNEQRGLCAVCEQPETYVKNGKVQVLSVDHCHATGRVRSLLCATCNLILGKAQDSPDRLRALINYLEEHAHA